MRHGAQQGILLLPVALTLAVIGALAYGMTREGGMTVSAVDAQYEIEQARYLAASGVQLSKWRAAKDKCNSGAKASFTDLDLHDDGGKVTVTRTKWDKGRLEIDVHATTKGGAVHALAKKMWVHSLGDPKQKTLIGGGDDDITIVRNSIKNDAGAKSLEATDGSAHPLVYFELPGEMDKALIFQANLKLTKESSNSSQADRSLAVHRLTTKWSKDDVTWTHPWTNGGGDYVATAAASVAIDPDAPAQFNGVYTLPIAVLVQGWADKSLPNHGMLLKPTRLVTTKFISFDGSNKPELDVRYYLRCT